MAAVIQWNTVPSNVRKLFKAVNSIMKHQRLYHEVTGDIICPSMVQGIDHIRDPRLNKVCNIPSCNILQVPHIYVMLVSQGLAFTLEERQALGIHGLMPPCFKNQAQQIEVCRFSVMKYHEDLNKFLYLSELQVIS